MPQSKLKSNPSSILIRNVTVVSMDEELGVMPETDILVKDGRIERISAGLSDLGPGSQVIDASGRIAFPGFINSHMHTWQTGLRGVASNWTLLEYFRWTHAGLATHFEPEDIYWGTLAGALNQINCGTTTLGDWCHNNPTPDHTDAAVQGLFDSGIRATFFHGSPKPDPKPGEKPFWEIPHNRSEIQRLLDDYRISGNELLNVGMAILGPHYSTLEVALEDFRMARDLSLVTSMHQGGGPPRAPEGWARLEEEGLLGPHINIVHGNDLDDDQLDRFVHAGVSFSIAAENEMTQGHGHPIIGRLRERGVAPSLGIDLESGRSGEMFLEARIALAHQRALDNATYRTGQHGELIPPTSTITTEQALRWVTIEGAKMLGLEDRVGSLVPGKQADLVLIDATQINMQPMHDAVNTVLMQTSLANIESVMINGAWRKFAGKLLNVCGEEMDPESWLSPLRSSGMRLTKSVGIN